jgi:hypothetical protein
MWVNGADTEDLTDLGAGTFSVVVTDVHGYTVTATVTLTQPTPLTTNVDMTQVRCHGESSGAIDMTVGGGTAPYIINWSNGATTEDITGLAVGNYSVVVTDANGCVAMIDKTITEPEVLVSSATSTNALCFGCANGTANLTVSGGTTPYTYNWSNGAATQNVTGLTAGTYSVTITDANGCTSTETVTITQPAALVATVTATNVNCYGGTNGTATLTVSGGTTPYTYNWSNGATTQNLTGLTAGNYTVVVTDAHGYTVAATVTVSQPAVLAASTIGTNVTCNGAGNGTIDLTVTGGTMPYTYSWSNGRTTQDVASLVPGMYTVTVTDANGCTATAGRTITQPTVISETCIVNQVGCYGGLTGYLDITVSGGTSPYTYNWSNGATTQDISGLAAGTYSVVITDANGCTKVKSYTLTEPPALVVTSVANNITCNGLTNGSVDLTVTGGAAPYTYTWTNGATTQDVTGLAVGTYTVIVRDAHLCRQTRIFNITQPATIAVAGVAGNVTCNGGTNGGVNISVTGGTAPYAYSWSNGATTEDINLVAAGNYTVVVTDANSCTKTQAFTVNQPTAVTVAGIVTSAACNGGAGSVDVTVTGGTAPYTYSWSNGATTQDVSATAGTYTVVVTDANSCVKTQVYTIDQPAVVAIAGTAANAVCAGGNGHVDITVTGGTAPYTYHWSNGATTQDLTAVAGNYTVVVTDAHSCTATQTYSISQPTPLSLTGTTNTVICGCLHGMGEIYLTVTGGTAPYSYLWSSGSTSQNDTGLWTGTYSVVVTDANGCTGTGSYSVISPVAMSVFSDVTDVNCHGASNGSIELAVTGGIPPYSYSWSTGATTSMVSGLAAGTYSVTITDANGCARPATFVVTEPATGLDVTGVVADANCHGGSGTIDITVTGGTAPYSYVWSNGATTQDVSAVAGSHVVTATDVNGCHGTASFTVAEPTPLSLTGTTNTVICGCLHGMGEIYLTVTGGVAPYSYLWSTGSTSQNDTGLWTGTYSVVVTDANGCTGTGSYSVISPVAMSVFSDVTDVNCHGASNGSIELAVTGGIPPYSYSWSTGATTSMVSGLAAGTYSVTITDANGCARPATFVVHDATPMLVTADVTNTLCTDGASGSIDLTIVGGTMPYNYSWSNGATTQDLSGIGAGTYNVLVTDATGCTAFGSYTINYIGTTTVTIADVSSVMCVGSTISMSATPLGGVWSSSNAAIALPSASGMVTAVAEGVATITYTVTNLCGTFTGTKVVTVAPAPAVASITGGVAPVCVGSTVVLGNVTDGGVWSSDNTAVATVGSTGVVTTVAAGTSTISYTKTTACGTASATRVITVDGTPSAGTISGATNVCVDGIVSLTSSVPGGNWSNGNPLVAVTCPCNSGQVTGISAGTAMLSYTVTNACGSAYATYVVTVHAVPTITPGLITPVIAGHGDGTMTFTTTGAPATYSIVWGASASAAGFANVTSASITTSPMTVSVPPTVTEGTYAGTITVNNGYCTSLPQPISITVNESVNIYTYAGTGVGGFSGNGNAATLARMMHPYAIATDCDGNAYISDFENAVVRKVSPTGVITTIAGSGSVGYSGDGGPATAARMSHAHGVAVDAAGNVYFSDYNNHVVRKVSTAGIITRVAGVAGSGYTGDGGAATMARISYPSGLTLDGAGNLYIADNGNSVIRKVSPTGVITTVAGNGISGYAGDAGPATAARLFAPVAVHADGSGNLYVADFGNQVVRKVDASGVITTVAGNGVAGYSGDGGAATAAKLHRPSGVTSDNAGNIYFSELGNSVVRKVNASGIISTIAGTTVPGYSGDGGPALLADLRQPMGLSRDCAGRIYIADNANYAIRILGEYNRAPFFKKGMMQHLDVCTGSTPVALDTTLAAIDFDTTQTETWSVVSVPAHGTLVASTTAISTGSLLTPGGLTYTPGSGFTGSDVFVVKISDGIADAITTVNITVSVPPVAGVISGTSAICGTGVTHLTTTGTGGVWSSSDTSVATINAYGDVVGTGYGTSTISYTVVNSCGSASATQVVTYNPMPTAGTVIGAAKVCRGSSLIFTATVAGGTWFSTNTSIATVDADGTVHGIDTGTATIKYAVTNACGTAYAMRDITVEILPVVGPISGSAGICAGATTIFSNATPYGAWYSSNTGIATVDIVTGAVTGVSLGTAVVSYVHNTSCGVVVTTKSISVNPSTVTVPAIGGSSLACPGATTTLTNSMTGGVWSSSNTYKLTVDATTGVVTGVAAGTANVTYSVAHTCGTSYVVKAMTVNPLPTVNPITGTMSICPGWTITAANATPGGVWSSSNTALATVNTEGVITGVAGGMPVISYSVTNYCGTATATALVPVGTPPAVGAISGASATCVAADITLSNPTTGGTWTSSNTAVASVNSAGILTGTGAGTALISYTVHNGCGYSHATKVVTVNPLPVVSTITGPTGVCIGSDITLYNATTGGVWTSSSPLVASVSGAGVVTGISTGTATISYAVTNGCGTATATKEVHVQVMFASIYTSHVTSAGAADGCALLTVTGGVPPYSFLWSNGATTQNLTGLVAGTYSVLVTDAMGDTVSATANVTVLAARTAGSGADNVMHGAHPNPFVTSSIIRFNLPEGTFATVDVFSAATGQKVATVFSDHINAGEEYTATIDGNNLPAGVYVYRIATELTAYLGKVVLVK